jgi:Ni/Co efflux regulator RcnB
MKRFAIAALALGLAIVAPAVAKEHGGGGRHPTAHMSRPSAHMNRRPSMHVRAHRPAASHRRSFRASSHRTWHHRPSYHHGRHTAHRAAHHATRHEIRHVVRHAERHAVQRYAKVRRSMHAQHRFHVGAYRRPHGWYAHHWVIGNRLPSAWFARDYWLTDWALYGLWAPIDGLIWVRVGPDAMLIDPATGEIVAVDYDLFF